MAQVCEKSADYTGMKAILSIIVYLGFVLALGIVSALTSRKDDWDAMPVEEDF
jgi:hypothetical protein